MALLLEGSEERGYGLALGMARGPLASWLGKG